MIEILKTGYKEFGGVKVAYLLGDKILVIQRDNNPDIRCPNMWDLVGGGREKLESPLECLVRETKEEIGLDVIDYKVEWVAEYPSILGPNLISYFVVIKVTNDDVANIVFGDEGQGWKLMLVSDFLTDKNVIDKHQVKVRDYLKFKIKK